MINSRSHEERKNKEFGYRKGKQHNTKMPASPGMEGDAFSLFFFVLHRMND